VILPIPSGTRDVLPDEMRELRAITEAIRGVFDERGYGEVATPALEYEEVLERSGAGDRAVYRMFDEHGKVLTLRWDMTVPIARLVATRFATAEPPLRFSYVQSVFRDVRPQRGQARELLQAGIELVGVPKPAGTVEALTILCRALDAVGLRDYRIGLGSASLYPRLMDDVGVPTRCATSCSASSRGATWSASGAASTSSGSTSASSPCRSCAAAKRCSSAPPSSRCGGVGRPRRGRPPPRDLRPRPRAPARLLHRRGVRGLRPRRSARRSAAAGATTTCSAGSGARCPRGLRARGRPAAHRADRRGAAR
jgi:hypothetical protein